MQRSVVQRLHDGNAGLHFVHAIVQQQQVRRLERVVQIDLLQLRSLVRASLQLIEVAGVPMLQRPHRPLHHRARQMVGVSQYQVVEGVEEAPGLLVSWQAAVAGALGGR